MTLKLLNTAYESMFIHKGVIATGRKAGVAVYRNYSNYFYFYTTNCLCML